MNAKRFFVVIMLLTLTLTAWVDLSAVADTEELPHFVLGNLIKISGGNSKAMLAKLKASTKPKKLEGFDTKETLRRTYEEDATISDLHKLTPEEQAEANKLLAMAGEEMPENVSLKNALPCKHLHA